MRPPYHIMHVVHGLDVGGLEVMLIRLVKRLDPECFRCTVCCFDTRGSLADDFEHAGAKVLLLPRQPGIDYLYPLRLAQVLRRGRVDLAHLHTEMGFIYGALAAQIAGTRGVLYTEHGRYFPASPRKTLANSILASLRVHTVPVSRALQDNLVRYERFPLPKMTVIHNGVPDPHPPDNETIGKLRAEMGAGQDHILLGTVGRLKEVKDHAGLIHAMPALIATHPNVRLAIVGGGRLHRHLLDEIQRLGIQKYVALTGERKDVSSYLHAFDLFVLSSKSEGMPLSLLEGMAAGKPTVAMNVGGVGEAVQDGVEGFLVQPGNYEEFVQRVAWLIDHPEEQRAMGARGRQTFLSRFTIERMVAAYSKLYGRLLADSRVQALGGGLELNGSHRFDDQTIQHGHAGPGRPVGTMQRLS